MTSLQPLSKNPNPPASTYTKCISLTITRNGPAAAFSVTSVPRARAETDTHGSCVLPLPSSTMLQSNPGHRHKQALGSP